MIDHSTLAELKKQVKECVVDRTDLNQWRLGSFPDPWLLLKLEYKDRLKQFLIDFDVCTPDEANTTDYVSTNIDIPEPPKKTVFNISPLLQLDVPEVARARLEQLAEAKPVLTKEETQWYKEEIARWLT